MGISNHDSLTITKASIAMSLQEKLGISKKEASKLVDHVFEILKETLSSGENIRLSGFGQFLLRDKDGRMGRNPQTGVRMEIGARRVLVFKAATLLKEDINDIFSHRLNPEGEEDSNLPPKKSKERAVKMFTQNAVEDRADEHEDHYDDGEDDEVA